MYLLAFLSLFSVALLSVYGLHRLWLVVVSLRKLPINRSSKNYHSGEPYPFGEQWPLVCVQIPLYNEPHVAERVIRAVASFDYPLQSLEIQVLDDSTDDTVTKAQHVAADLRHQGIACTVLHRQERTGYKAGALRAGLQQTNAPFIAIFDADFVPPVDFLKRTLPCFLSPRTAYVQARWTHLNRKQNLLTRAQGVMLDSHFCIEHYARYLLGLCFNFNGTAGVWRKEAILDAGNWQSDTLTEDLDLSYRAFLKGWRSEYVMDVACPAELPSTLSSYKAQQARWAKGSVQVAKKILPAVFRSQLPIRAKLEAFFHLTGMIGYALLFLLTLIVMPLAIFRVGAGGVGNAIWFESIFFAVTLGSLFCFFLVASRYEKKADLVDILVAFLVGIGISGHCALSSVAGLFSRGGVFVRTPKTGSLHVVEERRSALLVHAREYIILTYLCLASTVTFLYSAYLVLPFILLLTLGYLVVLFPERIWLPEQKTGSRGERLAQDDTDSSFTMTTTSRSMS